MFRNPGFGLVPSGEPRSPRRAVSGRASSTGRGGGKNNREGKGTKALPGEAEERQGWENRGRAG